MEMPKTTDEFLAVMRAFQGTGDAANGNGDATDEIPLSTVVSTVGGGAQIDGFLMAPFQLTPNGDKLYVDNGVVTYAPVQDGYKEGLKYLAQMYSEGLINPESFTQDLSNQVNVNEAGEQARIGAFLGMRPGFGCDLASIPNSKKWEAVSVTGASDRTGRTVHRRMESVSDVSDGYDIYLFYLL